MTARRVHSPDGFSFSLVPTLYVGTRQVAHTARWSDANECRPFGLNDTFKTELLCPLSCWSSRPVVTSHNQAVWSTLSERECEWCERPLQRTLSLEFARIQIEVPSEFWRIQLRMSRRCAVVLPPSRIAHHRRLHQSVTDLGLTHQ